MKRLSVPFFNKYSMVLKAVFIGGIIGLIYALMTSAGLHYRQLRFLPGIVIGIAVGFMTVLSEQVLARTASLPFWTALLIKAFLYSAGIVVFLLLSILLFAQWLGGESYTEALDAYISQRLVGDLVFSLGASVFLILLLEVSSLLSPRFFFNYFTGRYHRPIQEERIFMFVDLRSSTTIAEVLGDLRYSRMLQDLFALMGNAILASRAEVYQYAGDEIILTWKTASGLKDRRCLHCFDMIIESIRKREVYFQSEYGLIPEFKAGMHLGTAVTAWVGTIKKEIAYHGDLLNTTARIQSKCNELGHDFIISEAVVKRVSPEKELIYSHRGSIELKGKSVPLELYSVEFLK